MPPLPTQRKTTHPNTATPSIDPISQSLLKDLTTGTLDVSDWTLSDEQQLLQVPHHLLVVSGVVKRFLQGQPKSSTWSEVSLFPRICQELESLHDRSSINVESTPNYECTSWTWTPRLGLTPEQQEHFNKLVQIKQVELEEHAQKMEEELLGQEKIVRVTKKKKKKKEQYPEQGAPRPPTTTALVQTKKAASSAENSNEVPQRDKEEEIVPPTTKQDKDNTEKDVQRASSPWNGVHNLLSVDAQQEKATVTVSTATTDDTKVILPTIPTTVDPSLRIQQLEQALAEKNKALQVQETHWRQKLREAQEQHADVIQALQLRLYIAENKVQTFAQALEQHVQTVGASVFPTTTPMEGVSGSRVRSRVADGGP
eukprot:Nitzschia sp. Nitz4//scaffold16_size188269//3766//4872//NITZ4_001761-RA/size188269-processed-gene-0.1-mRNA-1//1//CDS//3329538425//9325//frame0